MKIKIAIKKRKNMHTVVKPEWLIEIDPEAQKNCKFRKSNFRTQKHVSKFFAHLTPF